MVSAPVLILDKIEMSRLPMQTDKTGNKKLGAFAASTGFAEGLVEEEGVAHRSVDCAVEDVSEGFALEKCMLVTAIDFRFRSDIDWRGKGIENKKNIDTIRTTRLRDFEIIALVKL